MKLNRISLALGTAAIALFASTGVAQSSKPVSLGISGGASIPTGDFGDIYSTGFNGTVSLGFSSYGSPLGIRVDGMYNKFTDRDDLIVPRADYTIVGANANLVYSLPGSGIRPYLIGGGGIYGQKPDVDDADYTTDFGVNGGIGASFPLSGFNTFIEARIHHIFSEASTQFVPVTFGISF
ncbi:MAG TPA: outer membrane beta-barrel protein [Gemmatimonadaceae bacterium]|nr:outer membrane beta-barrel protein [Gemmatimonadaceae bacterium]